MRVVGDSGVIMDLPDSIATGLLSTGAVRRVKDVPDPVTGTSAEARIIELLTEQNTILANLLTAHPILGELAPDAFTKGDNPLESADLDTIVTALAEIPSAIIGDAAPSGMPPVSAEEAEVLGLDPESVKPAEVPVVEAEGLPAGNASRDAWEEFALANGKTEDDLMGLNRDAIRALFTSVPEGE